MTSPVTVDLLTSASDLTAVADEWNTLASADAKSTPYQSATITLGLWRIFASGVRPHVITARDTDGRLVGLLPTGIHRRRIGPMRMRVLGPLTLWHASYFDAVIGDARPEVLRKILAETQRRKIPVDTISFPHLRPDAHLAGSAQSVTACRLGVESVRHEIPITSAGGHAERNAREIRRTWRRLVDSVPAVRYEALTTGAGIREWFPRFATLHRRRWSGTATPSIFADEGASEKFATWFECLADQGRAELHVIRTDDALLAGLSIFRWRDRIYGWRQAAEPGMAKHGLGIQLTHQAMATAGARGDSCYDMGRGAESYKDTWTSRETPLLRARAPGPGVRWSLVGIAGQATGRRWTERWLDAVDGMAQTAVKPSPLADDQAG